MKLAFSTLGCPNWSLPQIVGAAAAYGFQGFDPRGIGPEIDITRLSGFGAELEDTLALLRQHELVMPCLNTSIALVTPAAERWEMELEECHRYARLAGKAGSSYLRVFGGAVPKGMTRPQALSMAVRHLRQLAKICQGHACQILLETHDQWSTSQEVMELVADFAPDEAAVLWDVEHPCHRGEAPGETAAALGPYLRHVHLKDGVLQNGKYVPTLLGEGDLPLPGILHALRGVGYDGWICLETEKRWHPDAAPEPEESLPQFVAYMKQHWVEV